MSGYEGVLPVDKPSGWTSHDVVAKARRLFGERRIGHTGTLDPAVTGVLPLCVGRATRLVELLQELPKEYEAELTLGYATDTEDTGGHVIAEAGQVSLEREQAKEVLMRLVGEIEQIPPMYSAVKKDGKRLYELARAGIEVDRTPRKVTIHHIKLLEFDDSGEWPKVRFRVRCSKGTYIRTLCVDIGRALGYPAVMSKLVRTESGGIRLDSCYHIDQLEQMAMQGSLGHALIPIDQAVAYLPAIQLDNLQAVKALNGVPVHLPLVTNVKEQQLPDDHLHVRVLGSDGRMIGIFGWDSVSRLLTPHKVFPPGDTDRTGE